MVALTGCIPFAPSTSPATAHATLSPLPTGDIEIVPDSARGAITVSIKASGLVPNTKHAVDIAAGTCPGPDVGQPLSVMEADEHGLASASSTVHAAGLDGEAHVIFRAGPLVTVDIYKEPIACVAVNGGSRHNPIRAASGGVTGTADLSLDTNAKTLTLTLAVDGLEPNSNHPAHLHDGRCEYEGLVAYPLPDIKADAGGHGSISTVIQGVSKINSGSWYFQVHKGPQLLAPEQATPLTCGNVG